jgi:hypothetical protein
MLNQIGSGGGQSVCHSIIAEIEAPLFSCTQQ